MRNDRPAKMRVEVSVGESVRILRELQELSQTQFSELTGNGLYQKWQETIVPEPHPMFEVYVGEIEPWERQ